MAALAAMPSASVALVVTRSATLGVGNGVAVAAGIVLADLVFVALAVFGLSAIAEALGDLFVAMKYLGATYLLWLGFSLWTGKPGTTVSARADKGNGHLVASCLAGFALTLADVKAIFFYASLVPMFIDVAALQATDLLALGLVTAASVGGVKIGYALAARRIAALARGKRFETVARKTAGGIMLGAGSYIMAKA